MLPNFSARQSNTAVFLVVWLLSVVYLAATLSHGWVPHDDGALGQSAERVLHGEIPHRDFFDPYTGGLAFLDALVFKLLGVKLIWLRLPLFLFFVLWVPAVYVIARDFLSPLPAAGVTLASVAWSVPNYPAAMPSWFNLFFATFGLLALAKYIRRPRTYWLILAGLAGGCSFLVKSVGLYFIAAVILFFIYREQFLTRLEAGYPQRSFAYLAVLTLLLSLFVAGLVKLVVNIAEPADFLHFVLPGTAIAALLISRERNPTSGTSRARFRTVFQMAIPFLVSAGLPVVLFLLYYWRHAALAAWFRGVFIAPQLRLSYARMPPVDVILEYPAVIALLFFVEVAKLRGRPRFTLSMFLVIASALVLLTSRSSEIPYVAALESLMGVIPILAIPAVMLLWQENSAAEPPERNQILFLLLAITSLCSLIQFPYAQTMYFCYVSAFVVLLVASLLSRFERPPRAIILTCIAFYTLFALFVFRPRWIGPHHYDYDSTPIELARAGPLRVSRADAEQYKELIPFIRNLSNGEPIFAGPDAPEVYFLANLQNPTPILFDTVEDPLDYEQRVRSLLVDSDSIKVLVLKDMPNRVAGPLLILRNLASPSFPHAKRVGQFTVYWRP